MHWTSDQARALSPDAASLQRAEQLVSKSRWGGLGSMTTDPQTPDQPRWWIWGQCKGSGSDPYDVCGDLGSLKFNCSCPSSKKPCKHAIALALLVARDSSLLPAGSPPAWAAKLLSQAQKSAPVTPKPAKPVDPEAQAKRLAEREKKVARGLGDLDLWLRDRIRAGLLKLAGSGYAPFDELAKRMTDNQCKAVANSLRVLARVPGSGGAWQAEILEGFARLRLLTQAWKRLDQLPPELQIEVRTAVGFDTKREVVYNTGTVLADRWLVVSQACIQQEATRVTILRTWLWGVSLNRAVFVMETFAPGAPVQRTLLPGMLLEGEVAMYPGAAATRGLLKAFNQTGEPPPPCGYANFEQACESAAAAWSASPFLPSVPVFVREVRATLHGDAPVLVDSANQMLPISPRLRDPNRLLLASAGRPIALFAELGSRAILPRGAILGRSLLDVGPRDDDEEGDD